MKGFIPSLSHFSLSLLWLWKALGEKNIPTVYISTSYLVISINSKHVGKVGFGCCYNWFLLRWKAYVVCKHQVTKIYPKYFHFQIIQNFKNRNLFNSIPLFGIILQNFMCVSASPKPSNPPMESQNYAQTWQKKHTHFLVCK